MVERTLIIGANGQLGTELSQALAGRRGGGALLATDIARTGKLSGIAYQSLDVLDTTALHALLQRERITEVYHLAASLSAVAERNPLGSWRLNVDGLLNVLEAARMAGTERVFWPSSIAAFGPSTPRDATPQCTIMEPTTAYGIAKLAGERWCEYYHRKYGLDIRSLRFPGLISYQTAPGGGTTDYAVDIFHHAVSRGHYDCYLRDDTVLPMMYMADAVRATLELMQAPAARLTVRSSYNVAGLSFAPASLAAEIREHLPTFTLRALPDARQAIADSWPRTIDDSIARRDWGWSARFGLPQLVSEMLRHTAPSQRLDSVQLSASQALERQRQVNMQPSKQT